MFKFIQNITNLYMYNFSQVKEITAVARGTASAGTSTVALTDAGSYVTGESTLNTVVNSNRVFINTLAALADLSC